MNWTRTHVGLVILVVFGVAGLVAATISVIEPTIVTGTFALESGGFTPVMIAMSCVGLLAVLAPIAGMGVLISGAKPYGQSHRIAAIAGLVTFILAIVLSVVLSGAGAYTRSGDVEAYKRGLLLSMFVVPFSAASVALPVWFLYKPQLRIVPAVAVVLQAAAALGITIATRQHSALAELQIQGTSVFLPRFDIPLKTGLFYNWLIVSWVASLLLLAVYALPLLAEKDVMVAPMPKDAPPADE